MSDGIMTVQTWTELTTQYLNIYYAFSKETVSCGYAIYQHYMQL
jgi:hypothetical protein